MAAALTLLGVIERARRPMALVLLAGAGAADRRPWARHVGHAVRTPVAVLDAARFLVAAGLLLLGLAVLLDRRPRRGRARAGTGRVRPSSGSSLPHLAMLVAVADGRRASP